MRAGRSLMRTQKPTNHYDSELSDFVHCPAEFGRLAVFGWSEESRANARWRYCLEELCRTFRARVSWFRHSAGPLPHATHERKYLWLLAWAYGPGRKD